MNDLVSSQKTFLMKSVGCPTPGCPTPGCPTPGCPTPGCPTPRRNIQYYLFTLRYAEKTLMGWDKEDKK